MILLLLVTSMSNAEKRKRSIINRIRKIKKPRSNEEQTNDVEEKDQWVDILQSAVIVDKCSNEILKVKKVEVNVKDLHYFLNVE